MNKLQVSKNFSLHEFQCNHCGLVKMDHKVVEMVQKVREHFNRPVYITSGYRCPEHNKNIGGVPDSQHVEGKAVDIKVNGVHPNKVADYCEQFADGLGRYDTFTHIDSRGYKARWDYR